VLSVGHLIERKGHDRVIRALALLPDCRLLIIGDDPERAALGRLAGRLNLGDRVTFGGEVAHAGLGDYYSAADILVLASSREAGRTWFWRR
jgi:teichuronic acid biosynthesis glycosyltransferase TuaC